MASSLCRRVNTVGIELLPGSIIPEVSQVLLLQIIRDTYRIADEELYGVALNGAVRLLVKLLSSQVYEALVERYLGVVMDFTDIVWVRLVDISKHYTWLKLRNVPIEVDETDLRKYCVKYVAQQGKRVDSAYAGLPEGTFSLKISLPHLVPSYVYLSDFHKQRMVTYAGWRRTCRICGEYDHVAAECGRRGYPQVVYRSVIPERGVWYKKWKCMVDVETVGCGVIR